jgi:aryl-alcohol dehydrogenase-like predicted oxidoreductase
MNTTPVSRRDFVRTVVGTAAAAGLAGTLGQLEALADGQTATPPMPERPFGKTGFSVRIFSLGGQATLEQPDRLDDAVSIIHRAIDLGVNYVDTAHVYGNGVSETYYGEVLKTRRKEVFLATKTRDRGYDGSMRQLETSLKRLQTDTIDLWQIHNVRTEDDLAQMFADDGAVKALEAAREQKIVRCIGVTGHRDPLILKAAIERHPFDAVLVALNAADRHRASFIDTFLPAAVEKQMAIIGMKVPARGEIFRPGGITTMTDAMSYVLTLPVSTIIVGISRLEELEENITIAKNFRPLGPDEMARLEKLTRPYFAEASFFKDKW